MPSRSFRLALACIAAAGCGPADRPSGNAATVAETLTAFRLRADFEAPLNANAGWAGGLNEEAVVSAERPFRLRLEIERASGAGGALGYGLQYRRNSGEWIKVLTADFPYEEAEERTPRVSIVSARAFANGAPTADLLAGSGAAYTGGAGVALAPLTLEAPSGGGQSEWEWALVIRRYADGAVTNEDGDRFEFRMTDATGRPVEARGWPAVTLAVPPRLLGGTFVETPGRIGPWQATNGDLYFVMEPAESFNVLMVVKSSDGGISWREVDGGNRPATDDLEGFATALAGNTIHMLHQISEAVHYHSFRTSDHPTAPDTWAIRDEAVAAPAGEPPVQAASVAVRSDGSVVSVYAGPEKIHLKIRSPAGEWDTEIVIDEGSPPDLSGPELVLGANDVVHLGYTGRDGTAWYRRIQPDGALTTRVSIANDLGATEADVGSILPLVYIPETDTLVIVYRSASGQLWERRIVANEAPTDPRRITGRSVVQNAVDSDQTGADAIAIGSSVHLLFIESDSGNILHSYTDGDGRWMPARIAVNGVRAQWVRGAPLVFDGREHYGYVYDAGSNGGSGTNWFATLEVARDFAADAANTTGRD